MPENENVPAEESHDTLAVGEEIILRLLLPTAVIVLAMLYVNSVQGRIALPNLRYPYFVIAVLSLLSISIYFEEIFKITQIRKEENRPPFSNSVVTRARKWQKSIMLAVSGFIHLWLINFLGFFASSVLLMVAVMVIAGERDYRKIVLVTAIVLFAVWLFTRFLNLTPPGGILL